VTTRRAHRWAEVLTAILLALATVATAWAGYQSSRWHGRQAESAGSSVAQRLEATRTAADANRQVQIDVATFTEWVDAHLEGDAERAAFYRRRFRPEFVPAFDAWLAQRPFTDSAAALSPFAVPQYRLAALEQVDRLEAEAAAAADQVKTDIQRADNYLLAVVLFAAALFFAGISTRLQTARARIAVLGLGCVVFVATAIWLATFPVTFAV
jgi:hypothetical protein